MNPRTIRRRRRELRQIVSVDKNDVQVIYDDVQNALHAQASLVSVKELIAKDWAVLLEVEEVTQKTLLHWACIYAPDPVVTYLMASCPFAVQMRDNKDVTPLYYACSRNDPYFVVASLMHLHPAAAGLTELASGETALHRAFASSLPIPVMLYVVRHWPAACLIRNKHGSYPWGYTAGTIHAEMHPAVQNAVYALLEAVLLLKTNNSNNIIPRSVVEHLQSTAKRILRTSSATTTTTMSKTTTTTMQLFSSIILDVKNRPTLSQRNMERMLNHDGLQGALRSKNDESSGLQWLVHALVRMNAAGRLSYVHGSNQQQGQRHAKEINAWLVLTAVRNNPEGLFLHLRENSSLFVQQLQQHQSRKATTTTTTATARAAKTNHHHQPAACWDSATAATAAPVTTTTTTTVLVAPEQSQCLSNCAIM